MKKLLIIICILLFSMMSNAQLIYWDKVYMNDISTFKVYVTKNINEADLKLFAVKYPNEIQNTIGYVYEVQYKHQADYVFVPVKNKHEADVIIFFCKYKYQVPKTQFLSK